MKIASSIAAFSLLILLAVVLVQGKANTGVIALDDSTFDKIVGTKHCLVEFAEYSWKGSHEYDSVGKEFAADKDILILRVDLSEAPEVKDRFDVEGGAVIFFPKGAAEPIIYTGKDDSAELTDFVVLSTHAKMTAIRDFANQFVESAEQSAVVQKVEDMVKDFTEFELGYVNSILGHMKKIAEKGKDYVSAERTRLTNLVNSKTTDEKKRQLKRRLATLRTFDVKSKVKELKEEL